MSLVIVEKPYELELRPRDRVHITRCRCTLPAFVVRGNAIDVEVRTEVDIAEYDGWVLEQLKRPIVPATPPIVPQFDLFGS